MEIAIDMGTDTLRSWLAILSAPGIGPSKFADIKTKFPDLSEVFKLSIKDLAALGLPKSAQHFLKNPDWDFIDKELRWAEGNDNHIVTLDSPCYPKLLKETKGAPPILFACGDVELLASPQLAVIGSRNPTNNGSETAQRFAHYLSSVGLTITSGLALGIDTAAHAGALAGSGKTIAVVGTGLDRVYPASNQALAHEIVKSGLIVSEFPLGTKPVATNFPRRNRIISGLSLGILVVEATLRSGSLITSNYAIDQGREVFAIPGSIHNPLAKGCHALIRQGAKLVEQANDILEELSALVEFCKPAPNLMEKNNRPNKLETEYKKLLDCLDYEVTPIDRVIERSKMAPEVVTSMLLILEMQGHVRAVPGGYERANDERPNET